MITIKIIKKFKKKNEMLYKLYYFYQKVSKIHINYKTININEYYRLIFIFK